MAKKRKLHLCYDCMVTFAACYDVKDTTHCRDKCGNCGKTKWGAYCTITKKYDKMVKSND